MKSKIKDALKQTFQVSLCMVRNTGKCSISFLLHSVIKGLKNVGHLSYMLSQNNNKQLNTHLNIDVIILIVFIIITYNLINCENNKEGCL